MSERAVAICCYSLKYTQLNMTIAAIQN